MQNYEAILSNVLKSVEHFQSSAFEFRLLVLKVSNVLTVCLLSDLSRQKISCLNVVPNVAAGQTVLTELLRGTWHTDLRWV